MKNTYQRMRMPLVQCGIIATIRKRKFGVLKFYNNLAQSQGAAAVVCSVGLGEIKEVKLRAKDIETGEHYRHKDTPTYGWARAIKVLKPREAENPHNKIIVKCEWSTDKNACFGLIKYFKPSDLMKA